MIITRKQVWALSTVGPVALTYAIIGTSAFADNASATVPVTSADQSAFSWGSRDQGDEQVGDQSDDVNQSDDRQDGSSLNND
jgi:hypothetical protein